MRAAHSLICTECPLVLLQLWFSHENCAVSESALVIFNVSWAISWAKWSQTATNKSSSTSCRFWQDVQLSVTVSDSNRRHWKERPDQCLDRVLQRGLCRRASGVFILQKHKRKKAQKENDVQLTSSRRRSTSVKSSNIFVLSLKTYSSNIHNVKNLKNCLKEPISDLITHLSSGCNNTDSNKGEKWTLR